MKEETMVFSGLVILMVLVASIAGFSVYQYWSYHQGLRKQGVVAHYVNGHINLKKIEDIPAEKEPTE